MRPLEGTNVSQISVERKTKWTRRATYETESVKEMDMERKTYLPGKLESERAEGQRCVGE